RLRAVARQVAGDGGVEPEAEGPGPEPDAKPAPDATLAASAAVAETARPGGSEPGAAPGGGGVVADLPWRSAAGAGVWRTDAGGAMEVAPQARGSRGVVDLCVG